MLLALRVEDCLNLGGDSAGGKVVRTFAGNRNAYEGKTTEKGVGHVYGGDQSRSLRVYPSTNKPYTQTVSPRDNEKRAERTNTRTYPNSAPRKPYRRLSPEETRERQEKGLCFRCDERFQPGHQCQFRNLEVLLGNEDGAEDMAVGEGEEETTDVTGKLPEMAELSLNSVVGLNSPRTMKVRGHIRGQEVVVLLDSGASHNFIASELVRKLTLETEDTVSYGIVMGTGMTVKGEGICKKLLLNLQNLEVRADFLPLELGSADVILGM